MTPDDPNPDVLSSLPHARPQRRSAKRDGARAKASAKAGPRAKASAKAGPRAKASTEAGPRAKHRAPSTAGRAAKPRAGVAAQPAPRATARAGAASTPRAKRIPPSGFQPPRQDAERGAPSGAELVGTVVQAAGELAQIGVSVGTHALRSALGRLGRG